jgi:hypothetical protein
MSSARTRSTPHSTRARSRRRAVVGVEAIASPGVASLPTIQGYARSRGIRAQRGGEDPLRRVGGYPAGTVAGRNSPRVWAARQPFRGIAPRASWRDWVSEPSLKESTA